VNVSQQKRSPATISQVLGEITWLLSNSSQHSNLKVVELNWLVMPAILLKQFHLFYSGDKPIGAALWAMTDAAGEGKIMNGTFCYGAAGDGEWSSGDRRWLVELIAPFSDSENKQAELMFADLLTGVFRNEPFKMMTVDPLSGVRKPTTIAAETGDGLVQYLRRSNIN
jgi:cytolysin-activating lysine-acyltransferase